MTSTPSPTQSVPLPQSMSPSAHVKMTADIATSYLGHNPVPPERVSDVIKQIHQALREVHGDVSGMDSTVRLAVESTVAHPRPVEVVPSEAAQADAPAAATEVATAEKTIDAVAETPAASEAAAANDTIEAAAEPPAVQSAAPAEVAGSEPAAASTRRGRRRSVHVPPALADGGRLRGRPRLKAVESRKKSAAKAPAEAAEAQVPAEAAVAESAPAPVAPRLPEVAWATTEHGFQPTYSPRTAREVNRLKKIVFVESHEGKTGGFVRCLEDGQVRRMLKKHLKFLGLPPAEYLAKWGLPSDFPLVHPDFSEARADQMKTSGLWEMRKSVRKKRAEDVDMDAPNVKQRQAAERAERKRARVNEAA